MCCGHNHLAFAPTCGASHVRYFPPPKPPLLPYRPGYPMSSAIGLFGGVFLGFGFVLLRERLERRISAPGEAQVYLDLPELGVIPLDRPPSPGKSLTFCSRFVLLRGFPLGAHGSPRLVIVPNWPPGSASHLW